jgi:cytochrome P450
MNVHNPHLESGIGIASASAGTSIDDFSFPSTEVSQCPYPFYDALRRDAPVFKHPDRNEYLISRRKDIIHVLQHPEIFSNELARADQSLARGAGLWLERTEVPEGEEQIITPNAMSHSDPPEHTLKRRVASKLVQKDRLRKMEPRIAELANEMIDAFIDDGEFEVRSQFADPLALAVVCELAGFSREDSATFMSWPRIGTGHGRRYLSTEQLADADRTMAEQAEYMKNVVLKKYAEPSDDALSEIIQAHVERDGHLNTGYLTSEANSILTAGNETTSRLFANMLLLLLQNPDQLLQLRRDRSLLRGTIEEALRFEAPTQWTSRLVLEDTEIDGIELPAGSFVVNLYGSANRDDTLWDEPDRFDICRPDVHKYHMAFGGGVHLCLGAPLARLEGQIALGVLLDRLSDFRFAPGKNDFANIDHFQKRVPTALYLEFDRAGHNVVRSSEYA